LPLNDDFERGLFPMVPFVCIDRITLFEAKDSDIYIPDGPWIDSPELERRYQHGPALIHVLNTIERGAAIFSCGRARLSPSFGLWWYYHADLWYRHVNNVHHYMEDYDSTIHAYSCALRRLMCGGMRTAAGFVLDLRLDYFIMTVPFLEECAVLFENVQKLSFGNTIEWQYDRKHYPIARCITCFPSLCTLEMRRVSFFMDYHACDKLATLLWTKLITAAEARGGDSCISISVFCYLDSDWSLIKNAYDKCVTSLSGQPAKRCLCVRKGL